MSAEPHMAELLAEVKQARHLLSTRDDKTKARMDELEQSLSELLGRPGRGSFGDDCEMTRKSAIAMCEDRHSWSHQKSEGPWLEYIPHSSEIEKAIGAHKAFKTLLRHGGDHRRLDPLLQKSLSAFAFFGSGWALSQEFSTRVLSCLTDQTDFLSLLAQETISGASIVFPPDNSELDGVG